METLAQIVARTVLQYHRAELLAKKEGISSKEAIERIRQENISIEEANRRYLQEKEALELEIDQ